MSTHLNHQTSLGGSLEVASLLLAFPFVMAFFLYLLAVTLSNRHKKKWPVYRTYLWGIGIIAGLITFIGPLADNSHTDFKAHMVSHLLLGMLAPLSMALAAPMTLLLRSLPVKAARKVTKLLHSRFIGFYQDPLVAAFLNIGGLWLLYTTNLFSLMHQHAWIFFLIHVHIFLAGYLFTISIIYIDPTSHRKTYIYRTIIFVFALAGHKILSKFIYANPPTGIDKQASEIGGMIMYYGGDAIEVCLIIVLFFQWYKDSRPKEAYTQLV